MLFNALFATRPATWRQLSKTSPVRHRPRCRPQVERLEDRLVPSLADGTVLIATGPSLFSNQDQSSYPTGIIAVDPSTGEQTAVSTGGLFSLPTYIAESPDGMLYVTDLGQLDSEGVPLPNTGAVIKVDPSAPNGANQTLLVSGLNGANAIAYINGFLYVANLGDSSGLVHNILQIDPNTGAQTVITDDSAGGFSVPTGIAAAPGNNLYVVDEPGNVQGVDPGSIWEVNLDTGKQTLITHGGLLDHPQDVVVAPNGDLIVGNTGSAANNYMGSLIRVNPETGEQTLVSTFGVDTGLDSVELGVDGTIFVGAISNGPTPGALYAVDPLTGAQTIVSADGNISLVEGIRVFHEIATTSFLSGTSQSLAAASSMDQTVGSADKSLSNLPNDRTDPNRSMGDGKATVSRLHLDAASELLTIAGTGADAVSADHVTALFVLMDGLR